MVNKSVVAKSNEDLAYPKSLEAMTNKFVSPWVVAVYLLRSGRPLNSRSVLIAVLTLNLTYDYHDDATAMASDTNTLSNIRMFTRVCHKSHKLTRIVKSHHFHHDDATASSPVFNAEINMAVLVIIRSIMWSD